MWRGLEIAEESLARCPDKRDDSRGRDGALRREGWQSSWHWFQEVVGVTFT